MRSIIPVLAITFMFPPSADAQRRNLKSREVEFMKTPPLIGDPLPEVEVFDLDGKPFSTASMKGHYSVLTFGCLTCPPSIWNIRGLEAVQQDYGPKGVKFYFIFKSLAHPELIGGYVQPATSDERLLQARQAEKQFGTTIPWIVDHIDNRLKHALGDRPNSQFLIDPAGRIVRKRAWSHPQFVRRDLEEFVGSAETITSPEDINLAITPAPQSTAPRGFVNRLERSEMRPIISIPNIEASDLPFLAKLRAEADSDLIGQGHGQLYLGVHLDPLYGACWNNLSDPLRISISATDEVRIQQRNLVAKKIAEPTDSDPREFSVTVDSWPDDQPMHISVTYFACVNGETCHAIRQTYELRLRRDRDGGGARSTGGGLWDEEDFTSRILASDKNKDGEITRLESPGLLLPHFESLDRDSNGRLNRNEISVVTDWLNHRHQPMFFRP